MMDTRIIREKQEMRYLQWSHTRNSSGTAGTFLKSQEIIDGRKIYYKLSRFDREKGIVGHECINEVIVDRILTLLGVEHLHYELIHADVDIDGMLYETWLCASEDFKERGETKATLENYLQVDALPGKSPYEYCREKGWQRYIDTMLAVDYLILNRDRHGANIEVLRNSRKKTLRIAPLFDHGLSFLCSCVSPEEIQAFDIDSDRPCQNYIGSRSTLENLSLIKDKGSIFSGKIIQNSKDYIFEDLHDILTEEHIEKIWNMLYKRWNYYESLCNT